MIKDCFVGLFDFGATPGHYLEGYSWFWAQVLLLAVFWDARDPIWLGHVQSIIPYPLCYSSGPQGGLLFLFVNLFFVVLGGGRGLNLGLTPIRHFPTTHN